MQNVLTSALLDVMTILFYPLKLMVTGNTISLQQMQQIKLKNMTNNTTRFVSLANHLLYFSVDYLVRIEK